MKGNLSLKAGPGLPPGQLSYPFARPDRGREDGTTQISIVDREGNLVSYTASVETVFGSRHLVAGMVMNNQLTDFSLHPSIGGEPVANQRRPGRRPMSSMAPTIVFLAGQPVLAAGSPGGRRIPHYVSRTLLAALAWQVPPHRAVALPHLSVSDGARKGWTAPLANAPGAADDPGARHAVSTFRQWDGPASANRRPLARCS